MADNSLILDNAGRVAYDAAEMAEMWGVSTKTWSGWVREGKAPKPITGLGKPKWPVAVLGKWLKRKIKERT